MATYAHPQFQVMGLIFNVVTNKEIPAIPMMKLGKNNSGCLALLKQDLQNLLGKSTRGSGMQVADMVFVMLK